MILKQERTVLTTVPISRLMNQLILEGKKIKQKNIINLAMTKMPVEYFDYYSCRLPVAITKLMSH
jgi:ribosomal protein S7